VVAGHARIEAARLLNLTAVPVDFQPFDCEADELAYLVADNRIAELAERDNATIKDLLEVLDDGQFDTDLTGYCQQEIERLVNQFQVPDFQPGTQDEQGQLDKLAPKFVGCPECGNRFDARDQL
jgi:ParB-like chromosome segregation protein Spo0J